LPEIAHHHTAALAHHFDNLDQQREAGTLGMWVFLVTEVLFFGGLFTVYTVYRGWYPDAFAAASHELDIGLGTIETLPETYRDRFLGNDLAGIGFDTCTGVRIATTAVAAKLLGATREEIVNAISNAWVDGGQLTIFRQGNNTGAHPDPPTAGLPVPAAHHCHRSRPPPRRLDGNPTSARADARQRRAP